jgi:hypothetical protein
MKASLTRCSAILGLLWAAGCGSSSGDKCINLSGTWTIDQHCQSSSVGQTVTVGQTDCNITYSSPFDGWTGKISGSSIGCSGPAGSEMLSCNGTATTTTINLSCPSTSGGSPCVVVLSKQGGGGAKLGDPCTAAEEGNKACDGAKAIICRNEEGTYAWSLDSDCGSLGQSCVNGSCQGGTQLDSGPLSDSTPPKQDTGGGGPGPNSGQTCDQSTPCPTGDSCVQLQGWTKGMCFASCAKSGDTCPTADSTKYLSTCAVSDQTQTNWYCLYVCEIEGTTRECPDPATQECVDSTTTGVKICKPK